MTPARGELPLLRPADYQPVIPSEDVRRRFGIGVVGCGGIMRGAHLPAYRQAGYRVVAACDVVEEHARGVAADFGIPFWTTRLDELLARPEVAVVDLAVHAAQREPLVEQIAGAGKHVLSQKPFALSHADAVRMVEACERAGVTLMVNQQARWAPAHRALRRVIDSGVLGHVYSVLHLNRSFQDLPDSWYARMEHFNILDHGIHYLDLSRFFSGRTPERVKATTTMVPGQAAVTPMVYSIQLEYAPPAQLMATLHFNNIVQPRALHRYEWLVDGTDGSAVASQSELTVSTRERPEQRLVTAIQGRWFPDAFGGSMGELLQALAEGRRPATSGRDNLDTVRIAEAAVRSSTTGQAVVLS